MFLCFAMSIHTPDELDTIPRPFYSDYAESGIFHAPSTFIALAFVTISDFMHSLLTVTLSCANTSHLTVKDFERCAPKA